MLVVKDINQKVLEISWDNNKSILSFETNSLISLIEDRGLLELKNVINKNELAMTYEDIGGTIITIEIDNYLYIEIDDSNGTGFYETFIFDNEETKKIIEFISK